MVHTYSVNGMNIAVDGNSGSIHVLDNISYELISGFIERFAYQQAVDKLQDKYSVESIHFTITTNGALFDDEVLRKKSRLVEKIDKIVHGTKKT